MSLKQEEQNKNSSSGERKTFEVLSINFELEVDLNHILGSSIKKIDGTKFRTEYNLCSTLIIDVVNKWVNSDSRQSELRKNNIDTSKSNKYESKFMDSVSKLSDDRQLKWNNYLKESLINNKFPELAWNTPMWTDKYTNIKYTSSLPAGLISIHEATLQRKGRPWNFERNRHKSEKLPIPPNGLYPVIETCGVIIRDAFTGDILTFPNIKFTSDYSTPGGSIDYIEDPPRNLRDQINIAIENSWRELKEESGLVKHHFSGLNKITMSDLNIQLKRNRTIEYLNNVNANNYEGAES